MGYLFGSQDYHHGGQPTQCTPSETCTYDMWHDGGPGTDIVPQIDYSTDYYSELAIDRIQGHDRSRPFYMYLACEPSNCLPHHLTTGLRRLLRADQAVHGPFQEPPESEQVQTGGSHPWSTQVFASSKLHVPAPHAFLICAHPCRSPEERPQCCSAQRS